MAPRMIWVAVALLATFVSQAFSQGTCPTLDSIYPPSGQKNDHVFAITGTNLDQATLSSSLGTITTTSQNSTKIYFTINASNKVTITLSPTNSADCSSLSDVIDVKANKVNFDVVTLKGQPGTVMFISGCFPSTCGDNSTSYTVKVGGVEAELLDSESLGEFLAPESEFYIRLGDITTAIPQATITLVSEYGINYDSSFTIDYQPNGNITAATPSTGQKGTEVNITGINLIGLNGNLDIFLNSVTLGGVPAEILNATQSSVLVKAVSGSAGLTGITLNSSQLSMNSEQSIQGPHISVTGIWTYLDDGLITLLIPPAAQEGTTVRICGTSVLGGGTALDSVSFINVTSSTISSGLDNVNNPNVPSECVSAVVPAPAGALPQEGEVEVIADTKAIVKTAEHVVFKYANISTVSPSTGQEYTTVTIQGSHLLSGYNETEVSTPDVTLASKQATVLSYSDSEIVVQVEPPATPQAIGNPGDVVITVTKFNLNFKIKLDDGWTYLKPGNISSAEPSFGQVGTRVTLNGTNLFGYGTTIDYVSILGSETGSVVSDQHVNATLVNYTETSVVIDMPSPVNNLYTGVVNIVIVADNGAQITGMGIFEYRVMGNITTVSPANGQKGTFVTINGTNLFGYGNNLTQVILGDSTATILYGESSNTSVRVRASAQSVTMTTPVDINLLSDTNAKVTSATKLFSYLIEGNVSAITPEIGQVGTIVNITGTNLLGGGASISKLLLDGVEPSSITNFNDMFITVHLADDTNRDPSFHPGEIYIESDTGAQVSGSSFTHLSPGNITSISPTEGRRGTSITLTGSNLTGYGNFIKSVFVGDYEITDVTEFGTSNEDTMLVIQAPDGPNGHSGPITLNIDTGAAIKSTQIFSFIQSGNISKVSPDSGSEGRGVLVEGTNLVLNNLDITSLTIGGAEAARVVTQSSSQISFIAGASPNSSLTNLTIKIVLSDGSFTEGGLFSYEEFSLSVLGTSEGQHGTVVVLKVPFPVDDVLIVEFEDVAAEITERNNANQTVTVEAPRAQSVGEYKVDITVENTDNNIARLKEGFTYLSEGFTCTVTPVEGQMGTKVKITGENLLGGGAEVAMVMFGNIEARVDSFSNKEINVTLLGNQDGIDSYPYKVDVVVISDTGAIATLDNGFSLVEPGQITSITPTNGQFGTLVTITGTGLLQGNEDASLVTLAGIKAEIIGNPNDTHITVMASSSVNETVGSVSVVLSTGAEIMSVQSFQYLLPGTVTNITPVKGTEGTKVAILGKGMLGGGSEASSVELGGVETEIIDSSNTVINVVVTSVGNISDTASDVVITSDTGSIVTFTDAWSYIEPGNITSISPTTGQQGVLVSIVGTGLLADIDDNVTTVWLAGIPVTSIVEKSSTKIVVEAGYSNTSQTGSVVVNLESGAVITSLTNWSYYMASIDSVSPINGTNGTYITLTGTNIAGEPDEITNVSSMMIGGIECYDIEVLSHGSVQARAGYTDNLTSLVDIRIETSSGAFLVLEKGWSYLPNGVITSLEPSTAAPGENVTITGSRLVPDTATGVEVTVGKTKSFSAYVVNSSTVTFRVNVYSSPDEPGTALPLYIVANDGSTVVSDSDLFTFNPTTIADTVTPYAGQEDTVVVINGSVLLDTGDEVADVYLAGVPAEIIEYTSTQVTVRAGEGPNEGNYGSVTIVFTNGTFIGLGATAWTYLPTLTATHVSPLSGRNGTIITIDTTNVPTTFNIYSVYLGDTEADIMSSENGLLKVVAQTPPTVTSSVVTNITLTYQDNIKLVIPDTWSYQPSITIFPNSTFKGYYNSEVTLYGAGFRGGVANVSVASVTLTTNGFETEIVSQSDDTLVFRITEFYDSRNASVDGAIIIVSEDGAVFDSTSININFTYVQVQVDSVSPVEGQNGTRVSISGKGLLTGGGETVSSMTLAGVEVSTIESTSDTEIIGVVSYYDNSTGPEDIQYIVNTGAIVTIVNSWAYLPLGDMTLVTPSNGIKGTLVSILGERLLGGGGKASEVYLNEVAVFEILFSDDNVVHVRAGESAPKGAGNVRIVANTGATLSSTVDESLFEYIESGSIDYISPSSGQVGTIVKMTGDDLYTGEGIRRVTIAGVEADIISYNSTHLEVSLQRPPTTSSFSDIVVIESANRALIESSTNFTYLREGDITSVVPSQGQLHTQVTIRGNRLLGGGSVLVSVVIAGVPANIMTQTNTEVKVRVNESIDSAISDISGDIVLKADSGAQVSLIDSWTYIQVGVASSVEPESGQYGTRITITGDRLMAGGTSVMTVVIGDTESLEVLSSSDTEVTFRAGEPSTDSPFSGTIKLISNDFGELVTNVSFNYTRFGQINDIQPANGTGGTVIVISGVNLLGGGDKGLNITSVEIAGISVNRVINESDSAIVVEVGFNPDGQEKVGNVTIETSSGSIIHSENGWMYLNECPIGQFGNNTNSCSLCNEECDHCYGPTDYECYSCKNFKLNTNSSDNQFQCIPKCPSLSTTENVCVEMCESNQFELTRSDFNRYCIDCHPQCDPDLSCHGNRSSQCIACLNVELNGECVEECPGDYFTANRSSCVPCSDDCDSLAGCRGPESTQCYKCLNVTISKSNEQVDECIPYCPSGFYTDFNDYCQLCHPQCHGGCNGSHPSDCYQCSNATLTDPLTGIEQCVEQCNENPNYQFYYTDPAGYCGRCHSHCSVIAGCFGPSASDCHQCLNFTGSNTDVSEFYPALNGECVSECGEPHEYYVDILSGNCIPCPEECRNGTTAAECTQLSCIRSTSTSTLITPTTTLTRPTGDQSAVDPLSAGAGAIGIAVGIFVVVFVIMLLVIVVLACRLRSGKRSAGVEIYPNDAAPLNEGVQLQTTAFNRINSNLSTTTNNRRSSQQQQTTYVEPISNINPVFNPEGYMDTRASEPLENTYEIDRDDDVSQTASEAYMEMELCYQQQQSDDRPLEESQLMPPSSAHDDPPPPPRPPRPSNMNAPPAPHPLPHTPEATYISDGMELLTQDEYEDPQIVLNNMSTSVLPPVPSRSSIVPPVPSRQGSVTAPPIPSRSSVVPSVPSRPTSSSAIIPPVIPSRSSLVPLTTDIDEFYEDTEQNVYEVTDSSVPPQNVVQFSEEIIQSELPPLIIPPSLTLPRERPSANRSSDDRPPAIPSRSRSVKD